MITTSTLYKRDFPLEEKIGELLDGKYLLKRWLKHLNKTEPAVLTHLISVEPNFLELVKQAEVHDVRPTGLITPNTVLTLKLPNESKVNGLLQIKYDRIDLIDYFPSFEIVDEKKIDYSELNSLERFRTAIHRRFGYKIGRTFQYQGGYHFVSPEDDAVVTGLTPLCLMVPDRVEIIRAWQRIENVEPGRSHGLDYQFATVQVSLHSSGHLFINDGIANVNLEIWRPQPTIKDLTEEAEKYDF